MSTMKAARYYGAKDLRIEQINVPAIEAGQVKIKVAWCGICGSDLHEYTDGPVLAPSCTKAHGITGETLPIGMGHEFSGTITEVGPQLKGDWKVGDRVVVEPTITCTKCYACSSGSSNACSSLGFLGLSGWGGGLSEYVSVREEMIHHLPDNVSFQYGAMVEPLCVAMHAVEASGVKAGQTALVLGAGPIGCFVVKSLLARGVSKVIVSEPSDARRRMAQTAGAHHVISPKEVDVISEVRRLTGGDDLGTDVSFECAGVQATINVAIGALKPKGVCVNVAIWSIKPQIDMNNLLLSERTLKGVICYKNNHPAALKALSEGSITLDGFVTAKIKLDDLVEKGFKELINNNEHHVKILVSPTGSE